jgi:hypothetical protein
MRTIACLLLAVLCAAGCSAASYQQGPRGSLTASEAPPAPIEVSFEHRPGHVWVHGRWAYVDRAWTWQDGYYVKEKPGFVYRHGTWERISGTWLWKRGEWIEPRAKQIYVPGHFDRRHDTYVWIRERWEPARAGVWVPGRWTEENGAPQWTPGHWAGETPKRAGKTPVPRRCHWSWCNVGKPAPAKPTSARDSAVVDSGAQAPAHGGGRGMR